MGLAEGLDRPHAHGDELVVRDRQHDGVVLVVARGLAQAGQAVFVLGVFDIDPRVVDIDLGV